MKEDKSKLMVLSHENLQLLTEMFCLPYEHGTKGNQLLSDFEWLLENVSDIYEEPPSKEKVIVFAFLIVCLFVLNLLLMIVPYHILPILSEYAIVIQ